MDWATFWSQFKTAVDSNTELDQEHKLAYLRDAIKDPAVHSLLFSSAARDGLYAEVVAALHQWYDKRRTIHANYCARLIALTHVKNTKADLRQLADRINNAVSGLKHTKQYDLPSFLSSVMVALLPKGLQTEWEVHTQDSMDVPPLEELIKFINFHSDVLGPFPAGTTEHKAKSSDPKPEQHQRNHHRAAVNSAAPKVNTPKASSAGPVGFRCECMLCPGSKHPLFSCQTFLDMTIQQREDHIT